jgi:hypothetical protein
MSVLDPSASVNDVMDVINEKIEAILFPLKASQILFI